MNENSTENARHIAMNQVLQTLVAPPGDTMQDFLDLFTSRELEKDSFFQRVDEHASEICFINAGLLRMYYITADGKEMNKSFIMENSFAASYSAWLSRKPARFSIQAIETSQLLVAKLEQVISMFDRHTCWERLGRLLVEQLYVRKEQREAEFLQDDAETRYMHFKQRYPGLEERIAQYHVASYLGITPVALSRIRNRIKA